MSMDLPRIYSASDTELSGEFAFRVAGWSKMVFPGEYDEELVLWKSADGKMHNPPTFATSLDALAPFMNVTWMNIRNHYNDGGKLFWEVSAQNICVAHDSLARAVCVAILHKKLSEV